MRFFIDVDGSVFDIEPMYHRAHCEVARAVGWSQLDAGTFRRAYRKNGRNALVLPGAKPAKIEAYQRRFTDALETTIALDALRLHDGVDDALAIITSYGACQGVTLGSLTECRERILAERGLLDGLGGVVSLSEDPRKRPGELSVLSAGDRRTLVVTPDDALCRAAAAAELFVVGLDSGMCAKARLLQSGVDIVYSELRDLAEALEAGGADLIEAGLLPPSMD